MSGFHNEGVDKEFFAGTDIKSNFLCNLGYGDPAGPLPRLPRFTFDDNLLSRLEARASTYLGQSPFLSGTGTSNPFSVTEAQAIQADEIYEFCRTALSECFDRLAIVELWQNAAAN